MNSVPPSTANTKVDKLGPKPDGKVDVGNFNMRRVVSKFKELLTTAGNHAAGKCRSVDLANRKVEPLGSCDKKLPIFKQIPKTAALLLKRSSAALFHEITKKPKINSDGDPIPDSKTLRQVNAFSQSSNDLGFVLSKLQFHKKNEDNLNERSDSIRQLKSTPDSKTLQDKKAKLDKAVGGYHREANDACLSGFLSRARDLLKSQGEDYSDTRDIARLLGDEGQPNEFSLSELDKLLKPYFKRIQDEQEKSRAAGAA